MMTVKKTAINKVLIANRGEIALRVIRACREMGIKSVAVHSTADKDAMFVKMADESVCIGGPLSKDSYLNMNAIISAAVITGADAIHPGYGFLSETPDFIAMVEEHGIEWIGPKSETVRKMGDKIEAKTSAIAAGIPVVPGDAESVDTLEDALKKATEMKYPVILKARSGGGGKGIKIIHTESDMKELYPMARQEAKANFGDDVVYMEKFLQNPKHIEIQVIADKHGNVLTLGERDCSLQRNQQKVIEEALAPTLTDEHREKIYAIVRKAVKEIGYYNAGTIEFLFENDEFYFMEMNTRIQVEHTVTEMVFGVDLIREQIRVAAGEKLGYSQDDLKPTCHAIEFRINAEDPETFTPWPGLIKHYHAPGGLGVRVDSGLYSGYRIPSCYDSMIAKLIISAPTRKECFSRAKNALKEFVVEGIRTNIPLHLELLEQKDVIKGEFDQNWLGKYLEKKAKAKAKKK
jgi:acetyl-CoA carboxylase biotin carboxylase subunit